MEYKNSPSDRKILIPVPDLVSIYVEIKMILRAEMRTIKQSPSRPFVIPSANFGISHE